MGTEFHSRPLVLEQFNLHGDRMMLLWLTYLNFFVYNKEIMQR